MYHPLTQDDYAQLGWRCAADVLFTMPNRLIAYTPVTTLVDVAPDTRVVVQARVRPHQPIYGAALYEMLSGELIQVQHRFEYPTPVPGVVYTLAGIAQTTRSIMGRIGFIKAVHKRTVDNTYPAPEARFYKRKGVDGRRIGATVQGAKTHWPVPEFFSVPGWPTLEQAVRASVTADPETFAATPEGQRMAIDELVAMKVMLARARADNMGRPSPVIPHGSALQARFLADVCPFQLTPGQKDAVAGLRFDDPQASTAVLEGDVGCGKTLVAFTVMLDVVAAGHNAVLAAPLGTLVRQHHQELKGYCDKLGIECHLVVNTTTKAARAKIITAMAKRPGILVGTHAALDTVRNNIGMLVIDEQHLFGVQQREQLLHACDIRPHLLMLSATIQPRSLSQLLSGDVRRQVLKEKPPGRAPITTRTMAGAEINDVADDVLKYVQNTQQQVYWVLPAVQEDNALDLPSAQARYAHLCKRWGDKVRIGLAHGALAAAELATVFDAFRAGEIDVLVASTVVQVGISVSSANLMVVEGAQRFGVAQLHQLRGRVGRGTEPGHCWLITDNPNDRADAVASTTDGFELARMDAAQRGMGSQLGEDQHGRGELRLFDPATHGDDATLALANAAQASMTPEQADALLAFYGYGETTRVRARA
jgi:RecG-like helicase